MAHLKTYAGTIVGYTFNAAVYCIDCTSEYIDESDNPEELEKAANGEIELYGEEIPYPVFYDSESDVQYHCDSGRGCVNATTHHGYRHDLPVGQAIENVILHHDDEEIDGEPKVERLDEDGVMITVQNSQFSYTYVYEIHDDVLTHLETVNKGTLEDEWGEPPASAEEAVRFIINEGKALGEF